MKYIYKKKHTKRYKMKESERETKIDRKSPVRTIKSRITMRFHAPALLTCFQVGGIEYVLIRLLNVIEQHSHT